MIGYSLKIAILSIIILLLLHYMFHYCKTIFTQPKIKDYVNLSEKHYEKITELLTSQKTRQKEYTIDIDTINIDQKNTEIEEDELYEYMNSIL